MDEKIDIKKMLEENNINVRKEQQIDTNMEHTLGRAPDPNQMVSEYKTQGVAVDTSELMKGRPKEVEGINLPTINKEQKSNIEKYLSEMDDDIKEAKERLETTGEYTSVADLFVNDETGLKVKEDPKPEDDPDAIIVEEEIPAENAIEELQYKEQDESISKAKMESLKQQVYSETGIPESQHKEQNESLRKEDKKPEINLEDEILEKDEDDELDIEDESRKTTEELKKKYDEAIVIIDKSGMGKIDFTDEERKKMEHVKKIKVEEVETVSLKTIRRKKVKKGSSDAIIKRINSIKETTVVLPISGLVVKVCGCSTFELLGLVDNSQNTKDSLISKWSLIHSKVTDTSLGKMNFNTFLRSVSQLEYDCLVYGILCATYPEEDEFPLKCPKCKEDINHKYMIRGLLRAERMSDKLKEAFKKTVDASYMKSTAEKCFNESLLNTEIAIELPESGYYVGLAAQSAYDFIYDSIESINTMDAKYQQAAVLASTINEICVPDPQDPGAYFEVDSSEDLIKLVYSLGDKDVQILGAKIGDMLNDMEFDYGLFDVNCPKRKCGSHIDYIPIDLDSILFQKYRQAMETNTSIE